MKSNSLRWFAPLALAALVGLAGCGPSTPRGSLHSAVEKGNLKTVQQHIAYGTDVNAPNSAGFTPLHLAARKGDVPIVKALLKAGADPNRQGPNGETALALAQQHQHAEVIVLLAPQAPSNKGGRGLIDGGLGVSEALEGF